MKSDEPEIVSPDGEGSFRDCMNLLAAGRLDDAYACLGRCLARDPSMASAYSMRAAIQQRRGRYREALDDITRALELRPGHTGDLHNRAVVLASLGRQAEAIRDYEMVLAREPSSSGTLNNLAWLLATVRDPALRDCRRAIAYARRAIEAYRSGAWLDTLAAAYAECGEFEQAVEIEVGAYALSKPPNKAFAMRLDLYRRGIRYSQELYR